MAGRPTDYSDDIIVKANEYLNSCKDDLENVVSQESDKYTMYKQVLKVKLPSIEGLALYIGIHRSTVYDWQKKYIEFSDIIERLLQQQAEALVNNGLSGNYNPTIAKVLLTKHGYTDKQEIDQKTEHSGSIDITWQEPPISNTSDKSSS
ncbi:MAG TPA: terminase small subunit [Saprospiraceae bacterium]